MLTKARETMLETHYISTKEDAEQIAHECLPSRGMRRSYKGLNAPWILQDYIFLIIFLYFLYYYFAPIF